MADIADTVDTMANTANILARYRREADTSSVVVKRENTATGEAEIGAAIGGVAVTGAAAADSSLPAEVIVTYSNWYPYWGWGSPYLTGTTGIILIRIILRIGMLTTVAPYQDSDSLGHDPSVAMIEGV